MNQKIIIQKLANNAAVFNDLLSGKSREQYLWKSEPKKWRLIEIICHLYDEEREDFRARTRLVLDTPHLTPSPINPVSWVKERRYIEQNYSEKLNDFLNERTQSVNWLQSLEKPNWNNTYDHPKLGKMSANLFLSNWLAHDYLHIRQILQLEFNYLKQISNESLDYAGNW